MTDGLVDTSVVIKWFHSTGESEVEQARALLEAHVTGAATMHILDLAVYEVGNVLVRSLGWGATPAAEQLHDLTTICGDPLAFSPLWYADAADLAVRHRLSFYDACWAAAARGLDVPLISADHRLLAAGLAERASAAAARLL